MIKVLKWLVCHCILLVCISDCICMLSRFSLSFVCLAPTCCYILFGFPLIVNFELAWWRSFHKHDVRITFDIYLLIQAKTKNLNLFWVLQARNKIRTKKIACFHFNGIRWLFVIRNIFKITISPILKIRLYFLKTHNYSIIGSENIRSIKHEQFRDNGNTRHRAKTIKTQTTQHNTEN